MDHHPLFDEVNEGHENLAVDAVFVEVIGQAVRGGDHYDARGEERFEQAAYDHRVGDVGDLHLVEGQQADAFRDVAGHGRNGVIHAGLADLMHGVVDFLHEGVEMHAARRHVGQMRHEHVHQHGFTAPDTAPKVQALGGLWGFAEKAFLRRVGQRIADAVELGHDGFLGRVGL